MVKTWLQRRTLETKNHLIISNFSLLMVNAGKNVSALLLAEVYGSERKSQRPVWRQRWVSVFLANSHFHSNIEMLAGPLCGYRSGGTNFWAVIWKVDQLKVYSHEKPEKSCDSQDGDVTFLTCGTWQEMVNVSSNLTTSGNDVNLLDYCLLYCGIVVVL